MNWKMLLAVALFAADAHAAEFAWKTTATSVALRNGDKTVWQLVFDPRQPKSYFHPLATVDGEVLTAFRPADHPWHRGLWFAWKFINDVCYWEEDKKTGKSPGLTDLTGKEVQTKDDFSARIQLRFSYHPPGQPPVLTEVRTLGVSAPDAAGRYAIDWTSVFTVGKTPIKFDRTPPAHTKGGVAWGGYAGLSLRFPKGLKGWQFRNSEDQVGAAKGNAKSARWADFSGPEAGIAVFDDPGNPRYPSSWYLNEQLPYFSPALLYNEPLELKANEVLTLRYRVLVHSHPMSKEEIEGK